jgi:peptide/nickel transport system ATP-binding protein
VSAPAAVVANLRVELAGGVPEYIVDEVSFEIAPGEIVGLVGESGSGKTTVGLALLGYARAGARIASGRIGVGEVADLLALGDAERTAARGRLVAYVPQDPASALNPALRIGTQLEELLEVHEQIDARAARRERVLEALSDAGLPSDEALLRRFPHQLSGGQQQRVALAMAFVLRPQVIVLDEPTTGLDVTTQARVLATVAQLCRSQGVAALYVTHDLAVVAELVDRVLVMYAGRVIEAGSRDAVFAAAAHPYTARLLAAVPDVTARSALEPIPGQSPAPGERPAGCEFAPRCPLRIDVCQVRPEPLELAPGHWARCHRAAERVARVAPRAVHQGTEAAGTIVLEARDIDAGYRGRQVLHSVNLEVRRRECVAVVGESGSGKTTLARVLVGLLSHRGEVRLDGEPLAADARRRPASARRELQYVFQNPYASLNPRKTVAQILKTPLNHLFALDRDGSRQRVGQALASVALPARALGLYPDQLSGGERQRVAIARALVCEPRVLVCDEITSALDVSVQAAIVEVLRRLREERELSMVFVTHNLALVRSIAERIVVIHDGRIVEEGTTEDVLDRPQAPYTQRLLSDTPGMAVAERAFHTEQEGARS